jgi:hypothetical protein
MDFLRLSPEGASHWPAGDRVYEKKTLSDLRKGATITRGLIDALFMKPFRWSTTNLRVHFILKDGLVAVLTRGEHYSHFYSLLTGNWTEIRSNFRAQIVSRGMLAWFANFIRFATIQ